MSERVRDAARQEQFLDVIDRDEAERRFRAAPATCAPLRRRDGAARRGARARAADDVAAPLDVPGFDRVQRRRLRGARRRHSGRSAEDGPRAPAPQRRDPGLRRRAARTRSAPAPRPRSPPAAWCRAAPTRSSWSSTPSWSRRRPPRSSCCGRRARRNSSPSPAPTSARGETVLRRGRAPDLARDRRAGRRRPRGGRRSCAGRASRSSRPATSSSRPAQPLRPGVVYDSNAADPGRRRRASWAASRCRSASCPTTRRALRRRRRARRSACDVVLLSGGTSKGAGDLSLPRRARAAASPASSPTAWRSSRASRSASRWRGGKPVVVLPGFPTSAIFTFHEFVAPVIRAPSPAAGARPAETVDGPAAAARQLRARPHRIPAGRPRRAAGAGLVAYPMGKGSGSVTTFSQADGFVAIAGACASASRPASAVAGPRCSARRASRPTSS